jgi:predicted DNA-binding transcriptional regulator YafY
VYFRYRTADEAESRRQVEPIGLLFYSNIWHLIGWCRLRKDYRDFRLDRVLEIQVLDEKFETSKRISISEYVHEQRRTENWIQAKIFVTDELHGFIRNSRYSMGYVSEERVTEGYEMLFTVTSVTHFSKWMLMLGVKARIIEPQLMLDETTKHVEALVNQYLK